MFKRKYVVLRTVFDKNKGIKTRKKERKNNKKQWQAQTKRNQQQLNKIIKLLIV